jgi:small GTP-binding protein
VSCSIFITKSNETAKKMDTRDHTILFVGNPGVGKSTLLNGLVRSAVFEAGTSYGQGLTTLFQYHEDPSTGNRFVDTPGLEDVKMRKQAADEISKALRHEEGLYKIVFVVTEEAGRLRPADGVTMKIVLDTLPNKNTPYGIIINKMSKKKMKVLSNLKSKECRQFVACLNEGRENVTPYILFYPSRDDLEDEHNALHEPEGDLYQFLDVLPSVRIMPNEVKNVNVSDFDRQVQKLESMVNKLLNSNKEMEKKIQKMDERLAEEREKNDALNAQLKAKNEKCVIL